jgi:hypothetical protein
MSETSGSQEHIKQGLLHAKFLYEHGQSVIAEKDLRSADATYVNGPLGVLDIRYEKGSIYSPAERLKTALSGIALRSIGRGETFGYGAQVNYRSAELQTEHILWLEHGRAKKYLGRGPYSAMVNTRPLLNPENEKVIPHEGRLVSLDLSDITQRRGEYSTAPEVTGELIDTLLSVKSDDLYLRPEMNVSHELNDKLLQHASTDVAAIFGGRIDVARSTEESQRAVFRVGSEGLDMAVDYKPYTLQNSETGKPVFSPVADMMSVVKNEDGTSSYLTYHIKLSNRGYRAGVYADIVQIDADGRGGLRTDINSPEALRYLGDILQHLAKHADYARYADGEPTDFLTDSVIQDAERYLQPHLELPTGVDLKQLIQSWK